jgi:DNA primase
MIAQAFIQDLIARADVVDVVGRHVQLKKAGSNFKGLCPFHGEKTPSFIVSPTRQTYHCFGCGAHGNAVGFLMEHAGLGFIDAVRDLAQQLGVQVPEESSTPEQRAEAARARERQLSITDALAKAATHYRAQLKTSPRAIDYLKGRGLTGEIAARFALGYAPEGWRALASAFARYDDPVLEDAGLVIVRGEGEDEAERRRYDRFRDRIMFPIRNVKGEVIAFGGRVLDGGEPKYLNSPETPVFVKGRELYGLHEARTALRERGYALVTEGYMDVVALAQLGFANAVATLGTACTAEHVQKLLRFTERVVFSFDGDAAGRRAATRALEAALPHASDTRSFHFLFLPSEHDPDSFIREHGAPAFERAVGEAVPLSVQLIEIAREGCDLATAEGRARLLATARPLWSALPDGALRRQLLGELAPLGGLDIDDLRGLWAATARQGPRGQPAASLARSRRTPLRGAATLLDRAMWLLLYRCDLWAALPGDAHDLLVEQPAPFGAAFAWLERHVEEHGPSAAAALIDALGEHAQAAGSGTEWVRRLAELHPPAPEDDLQAELQAVLRSLQLQAVEDELQLLSESGELSDDAARRLRELVDRRAALKVAPLSMSTQR